MLQEVLENNDFLKVSSARRLVNISGTVRAIDLLLRTTAASQFVTSTLEHYKY
jgi:hypothetical protein